MSPDSNQLIARAQSAVLELEDVVAEFIKQNPNVPMSGIVHGLQVYSDFEGRQRNYLIHQIVGLLLAAGRVTYTEQGSRNRKHYSTLTAI